MKSGSEILVEALKTQGVDTVFTLLADNVCRILVDCDKQGIRIFNSRHEATAVMMADAYALIRRKPTVCFVGGGPDVSNAATGVGTAWGSGSPVVLISTMSSTANFGRPAFSELDGSEFLKPITKWSMRADDIARIPDYIATAFREAMSGVPGPVSLCIPSDVLNASIDASNLYEPPKLEPILSAADPRAIKAAAELLRNAERPAIVVGIEAYWRAAPASVQRLTEQLRAPVFTHGLATSLLPHDFELNLGCASVIANPAFASLKEADVILLVGQRINHNLAYGDSRTISPDAKLIHISSDVHDIGRNRSAAVGLLGDAQIVLAQLSNHLNGKMSSAREHWLTQVQRVYHDSLAVQEPLKKPVGEGPLHPMQIMGALESTLPKNSIISTDFGSIGSWALQALNGSFPSRQRLGGLNINWPTLGASLPWAIGARIAAPNQPSVAVIGDGGFGFYPMEIETSARYGAPIIAVIANDQCWGYEHMWQSHAYDTERPVACELSDTRFDRLSEAMGGRGEHVEHPQELAPAIERALKSRRPTCINVKSKTMKPRFVEGIPKYWARRPFQS